ncbi:MAG: hypothetical protein ACKVP5_10000 [Aestuariivirga sp.]
MEHFLEHPKNIGAMMSSPRNYASAYISKEPLKALKWATSYATALFFLFMASFEMHVPGYWYVLGIVSIAVGCAASSAPLYWLNKKHGLTYVQATALNLIAIGITYTIPVLYWWLVGLSDEMPALVSIVQLGLTAYFGYYVVPAMLSELTGKSIWRSIGSLLFAGVLTAFGLFVLLFAAMGLAGV